MKINKNESVNPSIILWDIVSFLFMSNIQKYMLRFAMHARARVRTSTRVDVCSEKAPLLESKRSSLCKAIEFVSSLLWLDRLHWTVIQRWLNIVFDQNLLVIILLQADRSFLYY